jgi:hypothetical protein
MTTGNRTLGRLTPVDLREVWTNEADDFTPWLASDENIALLGEAIGMELEVEAREQEVGPFRADILCKETGSESWVLIENQLERTDHGHLGQLLTYAAGLKAVSIVWISRKFTDEHRAALDWLNEITDERFQFFGLEVEAWQIGDSPPAPKFNVVSKPNDWTRSVTGEATRAAERGLTDTRKLQLEFWTGFKQYTEEHARHIRPQKAAPHQWITISIGRGGFNLYGIASTYNSEHESYAMGELRADFVLHGVEAAARFARFQQQRDAIEAELGEKLAWIASEGVRKRRMSLRRSVDLNDRSAWPDYFRWLTEKLDRLYEVLQPRVRALDTSEPSDAEDR